MESAEITPQPDFDAGELDLVSRLALYRGIQYKTLFRDLHELADPIIVRYEDLAAQPHEEAKRIFEALPLDMVPPVETFVDWSSNTVSPGADALTTVRDSKRHLESTREDVPRPVAEATTRINSRIGCPV